MRTQPVKDKTNCFCFQLHRVYTDNNLHENGAYIVRRKLGGNEYTIFLESRLKNESSLNPRAFPDFLLGRASPSP